MWGADGTAPSYSFVMCLLSWAFAATAALEGIAVVQGKKPLVKLSEQMVVSCEPPQNAGQDSDVVWGWLQKNTGGRIQTEESYPYNRSVLRLQRKL